MGERAVTISMKTSAEKQIVLRVITFQIDCKIINIIIFHLGQK